jgi:hypothetical protein
MVAFQRFEVGHNGTLRASSGRPTSILKEAPEVMSRDREHTMSQSAAIPAAAVYRNVRTEDQGNSGSMPTHPQSCQAMTARDAENWRADAQHTERYVVRRVAR